MVDRAGRRILILVGVIGMTVSTFSLAAVFQIRHDNAGHVSSHLGWLALISLFCFMGFFEISLG